MDRIVRFFRLGLYMAEIQMLSKIVFRYQVKSKWKYAAAACAYGVCIVSEYAMRLDEYSVIFETVVGLGLSVFLFQGATLKKMFHFLEIYFLTGAVHEVLIVAFTVIFLPTYWDYEIMKLMVVVSGWLICLLIVTNRRSAAVVHYINAITPIQFGGIALILFNGAGIISFSTDIYLSEGKQGIGKVMVVISVIMFLMIILGVILFIRETYEKKYLFRQNQFHKETIRSQQAYYNALYQKEQEMRKFRHDIRAQLGGLRGILSNGNIVEAEEYLAQIDNQFQGSHLKKHHLGNDILDAVVFQSISEAEACEISVTIEGAIHNTTLMNTYDLCSVFSNAISNGIDACKQMGSTEKFIKIVLLEERNTCYMSFSNPATEKMYEAIQNEQTQKADKEEHGFGIVNIQRAVKENNGEMEYHFKDGIVTLEIWVNI